MTLILLLKIKTYYLWSTTAFCPSSNKQIFLEKNNFEKAYAVTKN